MRQLEIDGTRIQDDSDCYVIAEIGHNHQGSLQTARKMLLAAGSRRQRRKTPEA